MREVERSQVVTCLEQVGVQSGDGLLVHSAIQFLGQPTGGVGMYLQALQDVLGPQGTVAVPTFNFAFARGEDYDPHTSPAVGMGTFSEYVRTRPGTLRTTHPMQSFAVIGRDASELAACDTPSAFDDSSAVDEMVRRGYKLLLLGANIQAVSLFHYSEQRVGVPYRYWKDFTGRIKRDNTWQELTYRMYVRDMEIDARLEVFEIEKILRTQGQWIETTLNYGKVIRCRIQDYVDTTSRMLHENPWRFVTNLPEDR